MTIKPPTLSEPATKPPPAPPVKVKLSPNAVGLRFLISGLLLFGYFFYYEAIVRVFGSGLNRVFGADAAGAAPKVAALTLLGLLLVGLWWRVIKGDIRFHAPILITYILAIGNAMYGILDNQTSAWLTSLTEGRITSYSPTFVAIVATIVIELVMARFMRGK